MKDLDDLVVALKSGEYNGADIMQAWVAIEDLQAARQSDEWVKCADRPPSLVGHYDAYSPKNGGRYPDAYWDGENWAEEMEGKKIQSVTHYCSPNLPQLPEQEKGI